MKAFTLEMLGLEIGSILSSSTLGMGWTKLWQRIWSWQSCIMRALSLTEDLSSVRQQDLQWICRALSMAKRTLVKNTGSDFWRLMYAMQFWYMSCAQSSRNIAECEVGPKQSAIVACRFGSSKPYSPQLMVCFVFVWLFSWYDLAWLCLLTPNFFLFLIREHWEALTRDSRKYLCPKVCLGESKTKSLLNRQFVNEALGLKDTLSTRKRWVSISFAFKD